MTPTITPETITADIESEVNNRVIVRLAGAFFLSLTPTGSLMLAVRLLHALRASEGDGAIAAVRKFAEYTLTRVALDPPPADPTTDLAKSLVFHASPPDIAPAMVWMFVTTLLALLAGVEADTASLTEKQRAVPPHVRDAAKNFTAVFADINATLAAPVPS